MLLLLLTVVWFRVWLQRAWDQREGVVSVPGGPVCEPGSHLKPYFSGKAWGSRKARSRSISWSLIRRTFRGLKKKPFVIFFLQYVLCIFLCIHLGLLQCRLSCVHMCVRVNRSEVYFSYVSLARSELLMNRSSSVAAERNWTTADLKKPSAEGMRNDVYSISWTPSGLYFYESLTNSVLSWPLLIPVLLSLIVTFICVH